MSSNNSDADDADGEADGTNEDEKKSLHKLQPHTANFRFAQKLSPTVKDNQSVVVKPDLPQQRSILKNSIEPQQEEMDVLEAKKQLILRRRRLHYRSHVRLYEQWRRRQFSYDPCLAPCYNLGNSTSIGKVACSFSGGVGSNRAAAGRRRRQYRRQFSCTEECERNDERKAVSQQKYHIEKSHSDEQQSQLDDFNAKMLCPLNLAKPYSAPVSVSSSD